MNKSKFIPGDVYKIRPVPQYSDLTEVDDGIKVISTNQKGLLVEHVQTRVQGDLYWDSIADFREPCYLMLKGQLWVNLDGLHVDPLPDRRRIHHVAKLLNLGVYELEDNAKVLDDHSNETEYKTILEIILGQKTLEKVNRLKELLYVVKAKSNELQVILALVVWHTPPKDTAMDGVSLCTRGIEIAKQLNSDRFLAILSSHRAIFSVQEWVDVDFQYFSKIKISNAMGIPSVTAEEQAACVKRLISMQGSAESDIKSAYDHANKSKDAEVIGGVLNNHIVMIGLEGLHRRNCGVSGWEEYRERLKRRFNLGKEFLVKHRQESMLGYLYHNTANQLRFLGERQQAVGLAKEAFEIARRISNLDLKAMAGELLERIVEDGCKERG